MGIPKIDRSVSPPLTTRVSKVERRRQILTQAKNLFVSQGYTPVTLEEIADRVGITLTVLGKYFEDKKEIFLEVLKQVRMATLDQWDGLIANSNDPIHQLHTVIESYLQSVRDHQVEFRILHRTLMESQDKDILNQIREFYLHSEEILVRIIQSGQQSGVFRRSVNARVGAWELIRSALGYTMTLPLDLPIYREPHYLSNATECLLQSLLKIDV